MAQAQQSLPDEARVVSTAQAPDGGYNVTYEYAGRRYTTHRQPPGATIPVQVSAIGVTTSPVYQSPLASAPSGDAPAWENVTPEPGVVVSGNRPAPVYTTAPVYVQPGYVPAPVYVQPAYAQPYYFPPVGVSLNLGYSRGWGGGGWGHRGWR
ncbi:hypothetical protein [Variovorax sp. PAMC 28711]|uniref:hypothetical protein n=1 Tax=Variovorax sp. PAMC 28711 TaxID=1795631 RepID=UPI000B1BE611|nr:hypothetical protein [Variovorax sp. PAMC 28711]